MRSAIYYEQRWAATLLLALLTSASLPSAARAQEQSQTSPNSPTSQKLWTPLPQALRDTLKEGVPTIVIITSRSGPDSASLRRDLEQSSQFEALARSARLAEMPAEIYASQVSKLGVRSFPTVVVYREDGGKLQTVASKSGVRDSRSLFTWLVSLDPDSQQSATESSAAKDSGVGRVSFDGPSAQTFATEQRPQQPYVPPKQTPYAPPKQPPYSPPQPPMYVTPPQQPVYQAPPVQYIPSPQPTYLQTQAPAMVVQQAPQQIILAPTPPPQVTVAMAPQPMYAPQPQPMQAPQPQPNLFTQPMQAPPMQAPPMQAPPMQAPPMQAPPMQAPPMQAPPMQAPPMQAPPMYAPQPQPMYAPQPQPMQAPPVMQAPVGQAPTTAMVLQAPGLINNVLGAIGESMARRRNPRVQMSPMPTLAQAPVANAPIGLAPAGGQFYAAGGQAYAAGGQAYTAVTGYAPAGPPIPVVTPEATSFAPCNTYNAHCKYHGGPCPGPGDGGGGYAPPLGPSPSPQQQDSGYLHWLHRR